VLALISTASFHEAYVLASAALQLAPHMPEARAVVLDWLDGARPKLSELERAALRTAILEAAKNDEVRASFLAEQASDLLIDPFVRVRVAAAGYLELVPSARASGALVAGLRKDHFPRVREAALGALGSLRDDPKLAPDVEEAMIRALAKDDVPSVRGRAARTLDRLPRPSTTAALRRSLDKDESAQVRAEAARALGLVCDREALDGLTKAARGLTAGARDEADVRLGLNAVTALARLQPADLDKRLQPLTAESVPGPLRSRVESAIASGKGGCATADER
jgi:HEAT repeat protein